MSDERELKAVVAEIRQARFTLDRHREAVALLRLAEHQLEGRENAVPKDLRIWLRDVRLFLRGERE